MQVASNYLSGDSRLRSDLGMLGGGGLSHLHVPGDSWSVASLDESNAFSYVRTPRWMWKWCASPPYLAYKIAHLLPKALRDKIKNTYTTFFAPLYRRLAVGSSHSVHILLQTIFHVIGKALHDYSRHIRKREISNTVEDQPAVGKGAEIYHSASSVPSRIPPESPPLELNDLDWECWHHKDSAWSWSQEQSTEHHVTSWSLEGWRQAVRRARHAGHRAMVVMHFFSGHHRAGDVLDHLRLFASQVGLAVLMLAADLATRGD